jgi:hypothetical protein
VKFQARQSSHCVSLKLDSAVVSLGARTVAIRLDGANRKPVIEGLAPRRAATNYFVGQRNNWVSGVTQYDRVRYREVYPGIDLDYYWNDGRLEFDFVVKPGADPNRIRMRFDGADNVRLSATGDLVVGRGQLFCQLRPVVYQQTIRDGKPTSACGRQLRTGRTGRFSSRVLAPPAAGHRPGVGLSTYLGGAGPTRHRHHPRQRG